MTRKVGAHGHHARMYSTDGRYHKEQADCAASAGNQVIVSKDLSLWCYGTVEGRNSATKTICQTIPRHNISSTWYHVVDSPLTPYSQC